MVGLVAIFGIVVMLVMIALGIGLTWLSLRDDQAPPGVRSDDAE